MNVLDKINSAKGPLFTFELLPPLKGHSIERTYAAIDRLMEYEPAYINFTSHRNETILRERPDGLLEKKIVRLRPGTFALAAAVKYKYNILVVPHVLCGGFTKEETENVLIEMRFLGIDDVLALRGDPQKGSRSFIPEKNGHTHTSELIGQIMDMNKGKYLEDNLENADPTNFCVGVAGYPEKHFEAANRQVDMENLKRKVEAGASYIVTQMFFDNDKFFSFVQLARAEGIDISIIPGILPIMSYGQLERMLSMARVTLPSSLMERIEKFKDKPEDIKKIGIEFASSQCQQLIDANGSGLHFYTLNTSSSVAPILDNLGLEDTE